MAEAAHPQRDAGEPDKAADEKPEPVLTEEQWAAAIDEPKNPFPSKMTVPGLDGQDVEIELGVVDGVVYAPMLDHLPLSPQVRQYVTQYCAAWSSSVLTTGKIDVQWAAPTPPRRAQINLTESQLNALLGLAPDERLLRTDVDGVTGAIRFIVESPRLPMMPYYDGGPPPISLPIAAFYEQPGVAQ